MSDEARGMGYRTKQDDARCTMQYLRWVLADAAGPDGLRQVLGVRCVIHITSLQVAKYIFVARVVASDTQDEVQWLATPFARFDRSLRRLMPHEARTLCRAAPRAYDRWEPHHSRRGTRNGHGGGGVSGGVQSDVISDAAGGTANNSTELNRRDRGQRVRVALLHSERIAFGRSAVLGTCLHERLEHSALRDGVRAHLYLLRVERDLDWLIAEHLLEVLLQHRGLDLAKVLIRLAIVPRDRMLLRLRDRTWRALLKVAEDWRDRANPAVVDVLKLGLPLNGAATEPVVDAILGDIPQRQVAEPLGAEHTHARSVNRGPMSEVGGVQLGDHLHVHMHDE